MSEGMLHMVQLLTLPLILGINGISINTDMIKARYPQRLENLKHKNGYGNVKENEQLLKTEKLPKVMEIYKFCPCINLSYI